MEQLHKSSISDRTSEIHESDKLMRASERERTPQKETPLAQVREAKRYFRHLDLNDDRENKINEILNDQKVFSNEPTEAWIKTLFSSLKLDESLRNNLWDVVGYHLSSETSGMQIVMDNLSSRYIEKEVVVHLTDNDLETIKRIARYIDKRYKALWGQSGTVSQSSILEKGHVAEMYEKIGKQLKQVLTSRNVKIYKSEIHDPIWSFEEYKAYDDANEALREAVKLMKESHEKVPNNTKETLTNEAKEIENIMNRIQRRV